MDKTTLLAELKKQRLVEMCIRDRCKRYLLMRIECTERR